MKIKKSVAQQKINFKLWPVRHTLVARFGPAQLVRLRWPTGRSGRHELIGGTPADHAVAREWCALFAPEIVFTSRQESPIHLPMALPPAWAW